MPQDDKTGAALKIEAIAPGEGRYLYCVADAGEDVSLGPIGIAGNLVYTIPYEGLCAVVHHCPAQPYRSEDPEAVKTWIMIHQRVVDVAWDRWGTVLPLSFDTVIKGESGAEAQQNVEHWLEQEYQRLKAKMERVKGKAEYGVQVFWDPKIVAQNLVPKSPEIRDLDKEIKTKPSGLAYLYRQRLEYLLKREMEAKAERCVKDFYHRVRPYADDIRVEKTREPEKGFQMILNLSCLVYRDRCPGLGEELDRINRQAGFRVRFTGPWPPYSFVGGA